MSDVMYINIGTFEKMVALISEKTTPAPQFCYGYLDPVKNDIEELRATIEALRKRLAALEYAADKESYRND